MVSRDPVRPDVAFRSRRSAVPGDPCIPPFFPKVLKGVSPVVGISNRSSAIPFRRSSVGFRAHVQGGMNS